QLIQDLLRLSRIKQSDSVFESVDISELAQDIVRIIRQADARRSVDIVVSPDLVAFADANLLGVALENLLSNAWKYTRKQENACIELGTIAIEAARERSPYSLPPNQRVYFVKDNGAGFDMNEASKLFKPFQRLHNSAEFEGTGIGLATVQRIIHLHGGKLWADAAIDRGATFFFTLPMA
ncbi:MAG: ATP-binding protein, partial [Cyanobacteria bacterium J06648_11]